MTPQDMWEYAEQFLGLPYIWGADGPDAYDCSGFAQHVLAYLGVDPPGDQTAAGLYQHFARAGVGRAAVQSQAHCGVLVFYGRAKRIGHVAICLDTVNMIEAGGGGSETTTVAKARAEGAEVRVRPINRRADIVAFIRPLALPWDDGAPDPTLTSRRELESALEAAGFSPSSREVAYVRYCRDWIHAAAERNKCDPYVLVAIGSRESNWGTSRQLRPQSPAGTGDWKPRRAHPPLRPDTMPPDGLGYGRGLMQVDWDAHEFARSGAWRDPEANIGYGAHVLAQCTAALSEAFEGRLSREALLTAAIAAYNAGAGNVKKALKANADVDSVTTGGDYSRDVLARAEVFQSLRVLD
jgi:hypothetical protein